MDVAQQLETIKRMNALADTGLVYAENKYDRERYTELKQIALDLMAHLTHQPLGVFADFFMPVTDYPTVKVDVRGFVLNEAGEILMARESVDGKWTIPGGWADVGYSPSEVAIKEIREETGLLSEVVRLLAVYDKKCHPHPPQPFYIYKLIFLCTITGGTLSPGFDMDGAAFFAIDKLPELSEDRILESQLKQLYQIVKTKAQKIYFD